MKFASDDGKKAVSLINFAGQRGLFLTKLSRSSTARQKSPERRAVHAMKAVNELGYRLKITNQHLATLVLTVVGLVSFSTSFRSFADHD